MFENFVFEKIQEEKNVVQNIDELSKENILKSELSDFSKNYLTNDFSEEIDEGETLSRIEKSNKLYFNYAIRPKWTLLTFLFGNFESRPPNEIVKKLNVFPFYKFYTDAISDFIKSNSQIFVTKTEITSIIDETNKAIYERLTNDISNVKIKNFFLQIFNLKYNDESKYNLESPIPYSFLKIFLEDKSYPGLAKKFSVIKNLNDQSEINLKDIIKVLTDKYNIYGKAKIKAEEKEPDEIIIKDVKQKIKEEINKTESKNSILDISLTEKSLDAEKDSTLKEQININRESVPEKIYSSQLLTANEDTQKKVKDYLPGESEIKSDSVLKELFNEKQSQKILTEVYNSDLIEREKSFEKLNQFKAWSAASNHLKKIFKENRVDIYNKDVVDFVNILNEYFQKKE
ncbi:MAG: hypothetical protein ABI840_00130 [bacterium]